MQIQKIQIISDLICYGIPYQSQDNEVEQHLTISSTGRVWFSGYKLNSCFDGYVIDRKLQLSIGKEVASKILTLVNDYIKSKPNILLATDVGSWTLKVTDIDGNPSVLIGSMCSGPAVHGIRIGKYIRENIPIDDLAVFGDWDEDNEE